MEKKALDGPYDVPTTINGWELIEHTDDTVIWQREELQGGLLDRVRALFGEAHRRDVEVVVEKGKHGWRVRKNMGPCSASIADSYALSDDVDEDIERRRALWHAKQTLLDRDLTPTERGRVAYTGSVDETLLRELRNSTRDEEDVMEELHEQYQNTKDDVRDIDAFFDAPKEERLTPFDT